MALLGQALVEHAVPDAQWPGRAALARHLAGADVCFTNLETVIRGARAGAPTREALTLHAAEPAVLDALKSVNVDLLATANNHAFDLGSGGVLVPRSKRSSGPDWFRRARAKTSRGPRRRPSASSAGSRRPGGLRHGQGPRGRRGDRLAARG
ncbi:CapA family protein [Caulobacter segnis]